MKAHMVKWTREGSKGKTVLIYSIMVGFCCHVTMRMDKGTWSAAFDMRSLV